MRASKTGRSRFDMESMNLASRQEWLIEGKTKNGFKESFVGSIASSFVKGVNLETYKAVAL